MPIPPSKEARDANLDKLQQAVNEWAQKEVTRLENETQFLRAVLAGRGAQGAASGNLATSSSLVFAEVDEFLSIG